jgi:predicted amidohydrolase YtcJ
VTHVRLAAAWVCREIEPGKLADFVILSDSPTAGDPENLDQLVIMQTVKED